VSISIIIKLKKSWLMSWIRIVDHQPRMYGRHASRFYCSQDAEHKKPSKKVDDPAKRRDTLPMKQFMCNSSLHLSLVRTSA
jgi:hypothetical protein